jgi:hypothetical protein
MQLLLAPVELEGHLKIMEVQPLDKIQYFQSSHLTAVVAQGIVLAALD